MAITKKSKTIILKRYKKIVHAQEPTEEDMARKLTTEELIQLCRNTRCWVGMWKWNGVDFLSRELRRLGKFRGKSQRSIDAILLKTYINNPQLFKHIEREKQAEWILEWRQRKKRSHLKLDKWKELEKQKK